MWDKKRKVTRWGKNTTFLLKYRHGVATARQDTKFAHVEKLFQHTYRPVYLSVPQIQYLSESNLGLTYVINVIMTAIAQKQGIVEEKQQKINENVARVCYKRISTCLIRRLNLFTD